MLWENVSQTAPSLVLEALTWLEEFQLVRNTQRNQAAQKESEAGQIKVEC